MVRVLHHNPSADMIAALASQLIGHSLGSMREPGLDAFVIAVCEQAMAEARTVLALQAMS